MSTTIEHKINNVKEMVDNELSELKNKNKNSLVSLRKNINALLTEYLEEIKSHEERMKRLKSNQWRLDDMIDDLKSYSAGGGAGGGISALLEEAAYEDSESLKMILAFNTVIDTLIKLSQGSTHEAEDILRQLI